MKNETPEQEYQRISNLAREKDFEICRRVFFAIVVLMACVLAAQIWFTIKVW